MACNLAKSSQISHMPLFCCRQIFFRWMDVFMELNLVHLLCNIVGYCLVSFMEIGFCFTSNLRSFRWSIKGDFISESKKWSKSESPKEEEKRFFRLTTFLAFLRWGRVAVNCGIWKVTWKSFMESKASLNLKIWHRKSHKFSSLSNICNPKSHPIAS